MTSNPTQTIPDGQYVQLSMDQINEGRLIERLNEQLQKAFGDLILWERAMDRKDGVATVTCKINISRIKNAEKHIAVQSLVHVSVPHIKQMSMARVGGDKLLCQPTGSSGDNPDQMRMFDGNGNPTVTIDRGTGEVVEDAAAVAGRVSG